MLRFASTSAPSQTLAAAINPTSGPICPFFPRFCFEIPPGTCSARHLTLGQSCPQIAYFGIAFNISYVRCTLVSG